jgi:hypothetical protein
MSNVTTIMKKGECMLEKNFKVIFSIFFFLCDHKNAILGFYSKKAEKCSLHTVFEDKKNIFLHTNNLAILKL